MLTRTPGLVKPCQRAICPTDMVFLSSLYASSRRAELAQQPWPEPVKAAFLQQQFLAQHQHYQTTYGGSEFHILEIPATPYPIPIGRCYIGRWQAEIRLIDITLLPAYQGSGLGTGLLQQLLQEARDTQRPLTLHVEKANRALAWYQRHGLHIIADKDPYWFMSTRDL